MSHITVGIPAHNESERILPCLKSMLGQTVQPDRIVVILDNCTDGTQYIAEGLGIETFTTVDNLDKKAGALNQFIASLAEDYDRERDGDHKLLIADADSEITPTWLEEALKHPEKAVGGVFYADGKNGVLGNAQALEYRRYAREIARRKAHAKVLSGTSTLLSLSWLQEIARLRGSKLPGLRGQFYNTLSIVEDFDLTLCLKKLGIDTISPKGCRVVTESMPTIKELWKQRLRWQSGTLQTLFVFGLGSLTFPYFMQQAGRMAGTIMMILLWLLSGVIISMGYIEFQPIWIAMGLLFYVERQITARKGSRAEKWISATVLLDVLYDMFIASVTVRACFDLLRGKRLEWGIKSIDEVAEVGS